MMKQSNIFFIFIVLFSLPTAILPFHLQICSVGRLNIRDQVPSTLFVSYQLSSHYPFSATEHNSDRSTRLRRRFPRISSQKEEGLDPSPSEPQDSAQGEDQKDESFEDLLSSANPETPLDLPPPEVFDQTAATAGGDKSMDPDVPFPEDLELPGLGGLFGLPGMPPMEGGLPGPPPGFGSGMYYEPEEIQSILSLHEEVLEDEAKVAAASGVVSQAAVINAVNTLTQGVSDKEESPLEEEKELYQCYVEGMLFETSMEKIEKFFESAKPVEIVVPSAPGSGLYKGYAYLTFARKEDMDVALGLNRNELDGRWISIERFHTPLDQVADVKLKNLPRNLAKTYIQDIFQGCGEIEEVIKTRTGVAFIRFKEPQHAQAAVAMDGMEIDGRTIDIALKVTPFLGEKERPSVEVIPEDPSEAREDRRVHITGLHFDVTEEGLKEFLSNQGLGPVLTVQLPKFKNTKKNRGFGYITFKSEECATKALDITGTEFKGFELTVSPNPYKNVKVIRKAPKKGYQKLDGDGMIYIGGLPFKANEDSLKAWLESKGISGIGRIVIPPRKHSKKSNKGVAYVAIETEEMKQKALALDGENMEDRWLMIKQMGYKNREAQEKEGIRDDKSAEQ